MKAEKRIKTQRRAKQGYFDVTEADYQSSLANGLDEETLLKPGHYKFIRGGFKQMHPDYDPKTAKVKISICIDKDVLNHFRARAEQASAAPYQTQINYVLREVMERDLVAGTSQQHSQAAVLVNDSEFIAAVAKQVAANLKRPSKSRQRTKVERLRD
ncbi:MAG: BrnA antitoxin family protein [Acidobacteria bacterium]|nr:BrnA antitoxin family protein [Acidobacteriota bacterium]MCW5970220.1 BrnA antitoxin family protein [Blastocatellales bacterium]